MKVYSTDKIKNLALVGHSGVGKTTLVDALLYQTGKLKQRGTVEDKNTVSDYSQVEKERRISTSTSLIPVEYENHKINLIDTPGYFDFMGEFIGAVRAAESALLVMDAQSGIQVGTEKAWNYSERISLPRLIFLNKMDRENVNFAKAVSQLRETYGNKVIPLTITLGEGESFTGLIDVLNNKAYEYDNYERKEVPIPADRVDEVKVVYDEIAEAIAESSDELMEKFFAEEDFTHEDFLKGLSIAILEGRVVPLVAGSCETGAGIDILLDIIVEYMPAPNDERANLGFRTEEGTIRHHVDDSEPFSGVVFKTIIDPFIGNISLVKISSGKLTKETNLKNLSKGISEKIGSMFFLSGKEQIETDAASAGDIVALPRLNKTETGDTLSDEINRTTYKMVDYPKPNMFYAIEPATKTDEEKIGHGLSRLAEEDPTFTYEREPMTKQLLIGGQGNVQLDVAIDRLKEEFGVSVNVIPVKIPYKETIKGASDVQGRHRKQSGGAGQFGDVHVRFSPTDQEFVFEEEVFGGSVPRNYFPAVMKGIEEAMESGVLAGYPVTGIKAVLHDGSYHPVDSNEMAFKLAASLAFRKGIQDANPILLEPIYKVEVTVPEAHMGDVMGDLNKRRGRILGMESDDFGNQIIIGEAPYAELLDFAVDLRSMTHASGNFSMEMEKYEEVPAEISKEIIAKANADAE